MDGGFNNPQLGAKELLTISKAAGDILSLSVGRGSAFHDFLFGVMMPEGHAARDPKITEFLKSREVVAEQLNLMSAELRKNPRSYLGRNINLGELLKGAPHVAQKALLKANLDVGTLTNLATVTGGQSLGYISLDTQMARGTVRPSSFTLYQCLHKTRAYQVVDYWAYNSDTGSNLPGTAFQTFAGVGSGTLSTVAGLYELQDLFLKLVVNGRAMTVALAAQNSFVDVAAQENINAALTCLESLNWAAYWGNPLIFPSQYSGIASGIPAANTFNYQTWYNAQAATQGWSAAQTLFNMIYQVAGLITQYNNFGRISHAFMSPIVAGSLNGLATTLLNNIVTFPGRAAGGPEGIVVNGDVQGMQTRWGSIMFPIDLFINARDKPAQAIINGQGNSFATSSSPTPPSAAAVSLSGAANANSLWTAAYVASSGIYSYAAAAVDPFMNESTVVYTGSISGIAVGGAYVINVTGAATTDFAGFRIYRSGLTFSITNIGGVTAVAQNVAAYRYIGVVAASGSSAVGNFVDLNAHIPGSEWVFLLDLDESDMALDYRYLLPLTKIELFAQNLYMPWAVAAIGGVRLKIPKFHGLISNYVPDNPDFNPLAANATAS